MKQLIIVDSDVLVNSIGSENLKYISKYVLINQLDKYIEKLFDKLPLALQVDPEVRACLPCDRHYNNSPDHIDGPPPLVKNCRICQSKQSKQKHQL